MLWSIHSSEWLVKVFVQTRYPNASGQGTLFYIGPDKMEACDVEVVMPPEKKRIERGALTRISAPRFENRFITGVQK